MNTTELNTFFESIYTLANKLQEGQGLSDTAFLIYKDSQGNWHFVSRLDKNAKNAITDKGREEKSRKTQINHITTTVSESDRKSPNLRNKLEQELKSLIDNGTISSIYAKGYYNNKVKWCLGTSLKKFGLTA